MTSLNIDPLSNFFFSFFPPHVSFFVPFLFLLRNLTMAGETPPPQKDETLRQKGTENFSRWTILSVTTLSSFMAALDTNIVTIALPQISKDLLSGVSLLGWVITGYILANASFLLQSGKVGDFYGRKKIYLLGFGLFGGASALCGLSQNIVELIGFRLVQGGAASMLAATTVPLIFESFPPSERGAAVGVNSTAWAVGAITGPVVGGFLVAVDWRLIFYINVPIAFVAILVGSKNIPNRSRENMSWERARVLSPDVTHNKDSNKNERFERINIPNAALLAAAIGFAIASLTFFDLFFALISLVALVALVALEKESSNPLIDIELRNNKPFVFGTVSLGILQIAYLGIPFVMSFYFQSVESFSAIRTGLFIAPLSVALVLSNPLAGRLFDRLKWPALLGIVGALVDGFSTLALSRAISSGQSPVWYIDLLLVIVGFGGGFVWTPMISGILRTVNPRKRGVANGTAFTLINVGFAASIAIVIAISASSLPSTIISQIYLGNLGNLTKAQSLLFNQGLSRSLEALGLVNFIGIIPALLSLREQVKRREAPD